MGQRGRGCITRLQDTSENGSWPTEADWQAWAAKYQTDSEVEAGVLEGGLIGGCFLIVWVLACSRMIKLQLPGLP